MMGVSEIWSVEGYERCAAKVVGQAITDYRLALKQLHRHPDDLEAVRRKEDCERFFRAGIAAYSEYDGQWIMRAIQERVEEEIKG